MAKYSKKEKVSEEIKSESLKIANSIQKPGQTKEQTKLIAQGIQKGIKQYKKQQKAKARELDKRIKKVSDVAAIQESTAESAPLIVQSKQSYLPWVLLVFSWICFGVYFFVSK
ncbi:DUF2956 family protein [Pseudomonadota bacterium]